MCTRINSCTGNHLGKSENLSFCLAQSGPRTIAIYALREEDKNSPVQYVIEKFNFQIAFELLMPLKQGTQNKSDQFNPRSQGVCMCWIFGMRISIQKQQEPIEMKNEIENGRAQHMNDIGWHGIWNTRRLVFVCLVCIPTYQEYSYQCNELAVVKHAKFCHIKSIRQFCEWIGYIPNTDHIEYYVRVFIILFCTPKSMQWETVNRERERKIPHAHIKYSGQFDRLNRCWKLIYCFTLARAHSISPVFSHFLFA